MIQSAAHALVIVIAAVARERVAVLAAREQAVRQYAGDDRGGRLLLHLHRVRERIAVLVCAERAFPISSTSTS
jgi:hypothetical protein